MPADLRGAQARNLRLNTPLHFAFERAHEHADTVHYLLAHGADPAARNTLGASGGCCASHAPHRRCDATAPMLTRTHRLPAQASGRRSCRQ